MTTVQSITNLMSGRDGKLANASAITPATHWKMEVLTQGSWSGNNCTYATEAEAIAAGKELLSRWWVPDDSRAVPSDSPVNYRFNFDTGRPEMLSTPAAAPQSDASDLPSTRADEITEPEFCELRRLAVHEATRHGATKKLRAMIDNMESLFVVSNGVRHRIDITIEKSKTGSGAVTFSYRIHEVSSPTEIEKIEAPQSDASDSTETPSITALDENQAEINRLSASILSMFDAA